MTDSVFWTNWKKRLPRTEQLCSRLCTKKDRTSLRFCLLSLLITLAGCPPHDLLAQSVYVQGDIVEDFTLVNRNTGEPFRLSDFEDKIIFLEWFAWW